jgi:hypothetical protein
VLSSSNALPEAELGEVQFFPQKANLETISVFRLTDHEFIMLGSQVMMLGKIMHKAIPKSISSTKGVCDL